jgi:hypothetical protein
LKTGGSKGSVSSNLTASAKKPKSRLVQRLFSLAHSETNHQGTRSLIST